MRGSNLYTRWLKNQLTDSEKAELQASGDLEVLEKIVRDTGNWTLPGMKENVYEELKSAIKQRKDAGLTARIIPLNRKRWAYGLAASLAVAFGLVYVLFLRDNTVTYQCNFGQQLEIKLPDETPVILNGNSSLSFDPDGWNEKREVRLAGEGFFHVIRKGAFKVKFDQGVVSVLGTEFNVLSGKDVATVKCFEGKVSVLNEKDGSHVLTPGKGLRIYTGAVAADTFSISEKGPQWTTGSSSFEDAPLLEVINALSIQYDVEFNTSAVSLNRRYSGKFTHSNLESALDAVFSPLGISYTVEGTGKKRIVLRQ